MSTTFPRTRKSRIGYDVGQVEDFLEEARRAYGAGPGEPVVVTAESIRLTAFDTEKGGYSTEAVDAALERLEDAFAGREREQRMQQLGEDAWYEEARASAQEILDRLARPTGARFLRTGFLARGYDVREVDAFADQLARFFQDEVRFTPDDVRGVVFRTQRRGYLEAQVDLLLDRVVDVMLAVR